MLVETSYRGPTNTKGSVVRVRALTASGWKNYRIPWDYSRDTDGNHRRAALQVVARFYKPESGADPDPIHIPSLRRETPQGFTFIFDI